MANVIDRISVAEDRFMETWGVKVYDYNYLNVHTDLQDLLVAITQRRALAIEDEVRPIQDIINKRNARLEQYGTVLAKLTELQSLFTNEDSGAKSVSLSGVTNSTTFTTTDFANILAELGYAGVNGSNLSMSKADCEGAVSRAKSRIDEMNNDAQKDMTRLQSVVDRRDESYSTASSLMTSVSDTRSNLIRNL